MIVAFGSLNVDLVVRVERIALAGETVIGPGYEVVPGGKGANQALAARRAGAQVAMAGAVGRDGFADVALALLRAEGVDLSAVAFVDAPTGAAFISVDAAGRNAITVAAGANGAARAAQLETLAWQRGDVLLLQRETPREETHKAALLARGRGARVILNLAPAGPLSAEELAALDVLIVNEHEAAELAANLALPASAPQAVAQAVHARHGVAVIVTLGAQGALGVCDGALHVLPAPRIAVVDTTAAGDAFAGAFACALAAGSGFAQAMRHGLAAGSLACTRPGAQPSLPPASEIAEMLKRLPA